MILNDLLQRNREWAEGRVRKDPEYFTRLCGIQRPDFLWIGCSDSRVPANQIVGLDPGVMFVHRNIANLVPHGDANCMATVQYAVEVLNVRRIIVCGHYGCGGVRAVIEGTSTTRHPHVDRWLAPLRQLASRHGTELAAIADMDERAARLCEINVIEQIRSLATSDVVKTARLRGSAVNLYGLIYSLSDGLLKDLHVDRAAELEAVLT
jgi:carbonic anhydrase